MEFIDIRAQYLQYRAEMDAAVLDVMASGHFIMGESVVVFEDALSERLGVPYTVSCGNGTDALQLLYMAYEIGPGDAVFVPDLTFIATHEPACMLGAEPVFCDIDPVTYNLCPAALEARIQETIKEGRLRPRCIVAVDFLGNPCDWDALSALAQKYNLLLFEDAAQSFGATYHGKPCCALGDAATTSFFPTKPLGCYGDGGAVFVKDKAIADIMVSLRMHGKGASKYENVRIGMNSRLDTMQAAVLLVKLAHIDEELALRHKLAAYYTENLKDRFVTPTVLPDCTSAYAQYALLAKDPTERDAMIARLTANDVPSILYYPKAMHELDVFADNPSIHGDFTQTQRYVNTHFCLPFSPYIADADVQKVLSALR